MSRNPVMGTVYIVMKDVFSFATISNFDDHIRYSIPGFNKLTQIITRMSAYFVNSRSHVIDIGCSTGKLIQSIGDKNNWTGSYTGIEIEKNFRKQHKNRNKQINFVTDDVCNYIFPTDSSLVLSLFTLQFLNKQQQTRVLKNIYNALPVGGCFILCEKIYSHNSIQQEIITMLHLENKRNHFTGDEILNKEQSLRNMLTITTHDNLIESLKDIGFSQIDTFWQQYNFIGFIIIK